MRTLGSTFSVLPHSVAKLALAIANDTSSSGSYIVLVADASGNELGRTTVNLASKANVARFVDELVTLPAGFVGSVAVYSPAKAPFNVIGLMFHGNTFTTMPATVFLP
jgi:hypothetical protein